MDLLLRRRRPPQARLPARLDAVAHAAAANAAFLAACAEGVTLFAPGGGAWAAAWDAAAAAEAAGEAVDGESMDKVYTTLKQTVRDWAAEGAAERARCYGPVLAALERVFGGGGDPRAVRVLVPGAGLGRLAWECAARGWVTRGNEWSAYMLLASQHILNGRPGAAHTTVHPFAHQFGNQPSAAEQLRAVAIPDVDPCALPPGADFSFAAGDFLEVFAEPAAWDAVACCFFLDTARNVVTYLEHIFRILAPGGVLVNLGPLLYHFDDNREAPSVEPTWEELRDVLLAVGFVLVEERFPCDSPYIANAASLMQLTYRCIFFVARKPHE